MANTVKIKRSATQGKVPTTAQLELGELALNTYDGKLYTKKDDGTASVVEIGGDPSQWTTSGNDIYYTTGNVGIGTDSPGNTLELSKEANHGIKITRPASGTNPGSIELVCNSNGAGVLKTDRGMNVNISTSGTLSQQFTVSENGSERFRVNGDGNVGIGTSSTAARVDIRAANDPTTQANVLTVRDSGGSSYSAAMGATSDGGAFIARGNASVQGEIQFATTDGSYANYTERLRIDSSGNVGIGTTSPTTSLDIGTTAAIKLPVGTDAQRPTAATGMLRFNSDGTAFEVYNGTEWYDLGRAITVSATAPSSPGAGDLWYDTEDARTFIWTGSEWADSSPDAGFPTAATGDSAPANPESGDLWYRTSDGRMYVYYNDGSTSQWVDTNPNTTPVNDTFERNGTDVELVNTGDNVGIGTTPAVKLDVNGEIRASTGILFGTDTAADNTLNDYEEGTWTPVFQGGTTAGTYTIGAITGTYTKIGNQVNLRWTAGTITESSAGSGNLLITGIPFALDTSVGDCYGVIHAQDVNFAASAVYVICRITTANVNAIQIREIRDSNTAQSVQTSDIISGSSYLHGQITYYVA